MRQLSSATPPLRPREGMIHRTIHATLGRSLTAKIGLPSLAWHSQVQMISAAVGVRHSGCSACLDRQVAMLGSDGAALPRRVRSQSLPPPLRDGMTPEIPLIDQVFPPGCVRDAEDRQTLWTAYQDGVERGRRTSTDPDPETQGPRQTVA
jgi:hypothetical protein